VTSHAQSYMDVDKPFTRILLVTLFGAVGAAGVYSLITREASGVYSSHPDAEEVRFAPSDDLESYDIKLLDSAKSSVDIAMYALTDERLADELLSLANRGVKVRLDRDGLQLGDEIARAQGKSAVAPTVRISRNKNISIRVKGRSTSMHLKAYCIDGSILRTGSANWSESGERSQDNDLYILRDPKVVGRFESDFEDLWSRSVQL
jgi:phosphatidylserine/phosphatidylglycerophosphate/cardiolipin synthase-like enzyme